MATKTLEKTPASVTSEMEARDRVSMIALFLESLLDSSAASIDAATSGEDGNDSRRAGYHAYNVAAIAQEYIAELKKLEERPVAGEDILAKGK